MLQISPETHDSKKHAKRDNLEYRETLLIPNEDFQFESNYEINIFENMIVYMSLHSVSPILTVVKDISAAKSQILIFDNH